jgi:hypothetical protein
MAIEVVRLAWELRLQLRCKDSGSRDGSRGSTIESHIFMMGGELAR